jgi:predicted RNase H-like nuclease
VVADGRVQDSAAVTSDEAIRRWVQERWAPEVLLAIDAPLIVVNRDRRRPCENVLGSAYWREQAGPHPANLSLPAFRAGVRGLALARDLGLSVDPEALGCRPLRAAIEVYPHPALVCLYDLPRTLKYKKRTALATRRAEFEALLACLRGFARLEPALDVTTAPRWPLLEDGVRGATSHAALEALEDELDGFVCAYVGLHHLARRGRGSLTVGDARHGYIVIPTCERHERLIRAAATARGVPVD